MPAIQLYPHNQVAFENLKMALQYSPRTAVIQPTGTGKSFVALALIEENPHARFLYLAPSNYIFRQLRRHAGNTTILKNTILMTYQRLCFLSSEEKRALAPDYIILDEFHRCGADEWGTVVQTLVRQYDSAKLIGFTATPIRYLDKRGVRDMAEELFGHCVANYYSIQQAMEDGILPVPHYIFGDILIGEKIRAKERELDTYSISTQDREKGKSILRELRRNMTSAAGVEEILRTYLPSNHAKMIVFCRNLDSLTDAQSAMIQWLAPVGNTRCYSCRSDNKSADQELAAFLNDTETDAFRLLFCVDMLNEGLHIKDVDGIVMLRPTESPTVYLQQIGRCLASTPGADTTPIIFDLVNNYAAVALDGPDFRFLNPHFDKTSKGGKTLEIPFSVCGNVAEFQLVLDKFDHLFTLKNRWNSALKLLESYIQEYGRYPSGRTIYHGVQLGRWLLYQVQALRQGRLSADREEVLNALPGWENYQKTRFIHRNTFDDIYPDLKDYYEHEGHLLIPKSYVSPTGHKIGAYIYRLRRIRKGAERGSLTTEQIKMLDEIGMEWEQPKRIFKNFDWYFEPLLRFYRREGHIRVPQHYVEPESGCKLGAFISRARAYKKGKDQSLHLTKEQIAQLDALGMEWQISPSPKSFDEYYGELVRFHQKYGHILVPANYITPDTGCRLGYFIQRMRSARKGTIKGSYITQEQIDRLDALGMIWDGSAFTSQQMRAKNHYILEEQRDDVHQTP